MGGCLVYFLEPAEKTYLGGDGKICIGKCNLFAL
jgi:hypothetical protein